MQVPQQVLEPSSAPSSYLPNPVCRGCIPWACVPLQSLQCLCCHLLLLLLQHAMQCLLTLMVVQVPLDLSGQPQSYDRFKDLTPVCAGFTS